MNLGEIYEFFVEEGMRADLRGPSDVRKSLAKKKREFVRLKKKEKTLFDIESMRNPYADTRILYGDRKREVKTILAGIDVETPELILADHLRQKGSPVDLVLAHHPEGIALAGLNDVMAVQIGLLCACGVRAEAVEGIMQKRIDYVKRRLHSANHGRAVDAARLLDLPFMCAHTVTDNLVAAHWQKVMDQKQPRQLKDILPILLREPEYRQAAAHKVGPEILVGSPGDKAGKIFVDMTGGAEGAKEIFSRLSQAGIDTLLCMHLSEEHYQQVNQEFLRVVNAGHLASDNMGMNLMLDRLEIRADVRVIECGGLRRFRRS